MFKYPITKKTYSFAYLNLKDSKKTKNIIFKLIKKEINE